MPSARTSIELDGVPYRKGSSALVWANTSDGAATAITIGTDKKPQFRDEMDPSVRHREKKSVLAELPPPAARIRPQLARTKTFNSQRLRLRKSLFNRHRRLADAAFAFAFVGIAIMVFESEMSAAGVYGKCSRFSNAAKGLISGSTLILLFLIVWYYVVDAKMYLIDNFASDWLVAVTPGRIFCLLIELSVCIVHPFPGCYPFAWGDKLTSQSAGIVTVDVPLSILMFLRFYLVGRLILLHSTLFNNTSSRSIGALNQVSFNMSFMFRSLMQMRAGFVLVIFCLSYWVIASWCIRACDRFEDADHAVWWNAMWIIAITFTTVGYGDMYGITYCGRSVSIITGIVGVASTAFLIAVLTQQLSLTMAEKNVHNFVIAHRLNRRIRHAAARIIQQSWYCFKYSKTNKHKSLSRTHRRRLMRAIHDIRKLKFEQRKLYDDEQNLALVSEAPPIENEGTLAPRLQIIERQVQVLQERMNNVNQSVSKIHDIANMLASNLIPGYLPPQRSAANTITPLTTDTPQRPGDDVERTYVTPDPMSHDVEYIMMTPTEDREMGLHPPLSFRTPTEVVGSGLLKAER